MPRIVFWNVNKKDLTKQVCAIAASTNADVVVLNENEVSSEHTLQYLQRDVSADFYYPAVISDKRFHCFCKNTDLDLSESHDLDRASVRKLKIGNHIVLLALFHGLDLRNYDDAARTAYMQTLASDMSFVTEQQKTRKLLLLGDFNMNPYDRGMTQAAGMNAMMTRACTKRGYRTYVKKSYDFYYNPMWSLLGDNTEGPAGTIYDMSSQGPYGWSMFDQVVMHHSVINLFEEVKIITEAGSESLMNKNEHPDKKVLSDHFPILVSLKED